VIRGLALALLVLGAALWGAPALLVPSAASALAAAAGVELEFEGVRPALPWGMTAQRVRVVRGAGMAELRALSARPSDGGLRVEALAGEGSLLLKTRGLSALRSLRAQSLPLETLGPLLPLDLAVRGTADGVLRERDGRATLEATVRRGAVSLRAPVEMEVPFAQLVVTATREDDGGWRVDFADLRGPPLSGSARGRIEPDGRLDLRIEISALEEPALSAFALGGLPTGPLPIQAELGGTLAHPVLLPLAPSQH